MANFWQSNVWQAVLNADWAWTTLAWLLLIVAAWLLFWAMFRDRPGLWGIPRERCPECRYDMAGRADDGDDADGPIQCPECGKRVKHAKALRRTRRRWGLALLAVPLLVAWNLASNKDRIRYHGWLSVTPTVAIAVFVDPDKWYRSCVLSYAPPGRGTLAGRLHDRLLTGPGWAMDLWLWRSRGVLDREGWTIRDVHDVAPVAIYHPASSSGSPFVVIYNKANPEDLETRRLADLITDSIDRDRWIEMGGEVHRGIRNAGAHLLIDAAEPMFDWIEQLLALLRDARSDPMDVHAATIRGRHFIASSTERFHDTAWYLEILDRHEQYERAALQPQGGGGSQDPISFSPEFRGTQYGEWRTRNDVQRRIEYSLGSLTDRQAWAGWGGDDLSLTFIDGVLVVHADEDRSSEIAAALERIEEIGPEAVMKELGIAPDW